MLLNKFNFQLNTYHKFAEFNNKLFTCQTCFKNLLPQSETKYPHIL